jgi:nucleoredoxin
MAGNGDEQKTSQDYMSELLGDVALTAKDGSSVDVATLKEFEVVGFYFTAHWCPPCRRFTPMLAKFYEAQKAKDPKKFEVIFISSDRDEKAFNEYYDESHPWLKPTFEWTGKNKGRVGSTVQCGNGIPSLCLVDPKTGELISKKAASELRGDPEGAKFPWRPRAFWEVMADGPAINTKEDGKTLTVDELKAGADYTMLYFSAHWCPPCRGFTPKFAEWYTNNVGKMPAGKKFETVFFSSDQDAKAYNEYYAEMPWKAAPFGDDRTDELKSLFDVSGIPSVIVINNATGKQAEPNGMGGRAGVSSDPNAEKFPWPKIAAGTLADNIGPINERPMCIVFGGKADEAQRTKCMEALLSVANPVLAKSQETGKQMEMEFNLENGTAPDRMMGQIKRLFKLEDSDVLMITDLSNGCYYKHPTVKDFGEISSECVAQFVQDYKDGKLTKVSLE